jgi:hypothetical protein
MNLSKPTLLLVIAVGFCNPVWAEDWRPIQGSGVDDSYTYVDGDSIKLEGGLAKFRQKQEYTTPQSSRSGQTYDYLVIGMAADCDNRSLAMTDGTAYTRNGTAIDSTTVAKAEWNFAPVNTDSTGAAELEFVCSQAKKHP